MRKLRSLRWLCSLSLVASLLCGVAFGAGIPDLDDLGIDPWREYDGLPSVLPTVQPMEEVGEGEEVYFLGADADIMPFSVVSGGQKYSIALDGFVTYGVDQDGDEFDLDGLTFAFAPVDSRDYTDEKAKVGNTSVKSGYVLAEIKWRSLQVDGKGIPDIPISKYAQYLGRPGIINGDVDITVRSRISSSTGLVRIRLDSFEPTEGVESITLNDFVFGYFPWYTYYPDASYLNDYGSAISSRALFNGAYLYVNGVEHSSLSSTVSGDAIYTLNGSSSFRCEIDNQTVLFEGKPYIETLEIVLSFSIPSYTSEKLTNGGWAVMVGGVRSGQSSYAAYSGATLAVQSDTSSVNTGLLNSIIEFLRNIVSGIGNIASSIAQLPGKIANLILDGLKSLFIPSQEDIEAIKDKYMTLLEERLGFLWQAMTFISDTAQKFLMALEGSSDYVFNLPALTITLPSGEFTLVQAQTLDFDNGLMTAVRTAAGTMVSFVVVLGFLNVSEKMVIAIVSGKSYFDYLKGGGEE